MGWTPPKDLPVAVDPWPVERVELDPTGSLLSWRTYDPWPNPRTVETQGLVELKASPEGPFTRFIRLAGLDHDAPELAIEVLELASDVGPLKLCAAHGWPAAHHQQVPRSARPDGREVSSCDPAFIEATVEGTDYEAKPWYIEPIARWHELAEQAAAAIAVATELRNGHPVEHRVEWERLLLPDGDAGTLADPYRYSGLEVDDGTVIPDDPVAKERLERLDEQRRAVASVVQEWLNRGGVSTRLIWSAPAASGRSTKKNPAPADVKPRLTLGAGDLFSYLALQFALRILGIKGLGFCRYCGRSYEPSRMKNAGICCGDDLCKLDMEAEHEMASRRREGDKTRHTR